MILSFIHKIKQAITRRPIKLFHGLSIYDLMLLRNLGKEATAEHHNHHIDFLLDEQRARLEAWETAEQTKNKFRKLGVDLFEPKPPENIILPFKKRTTNWGP